MSSGSRKYHTKSRNSCTQCRNRRVRCNLQAPICSNCEKREDRCSFFENHGYSTVKAHIKAAHTSSWDISYAGTFISNSKELLSHYVHETAPTLPFFENIFPVFWRYTVPSLAEHHQFLWQCLLGISALHLSDLHPAFNVQYLELARIQHLRATSQFLSSTTDVKPDNAMALVAFVIFVIIFHFKGSIKQGATSKNHITEVLEPFLALRSALTLVERVKGEFKRENGFGFQGRTQTDDTDAKDMPNFVPDHIRGSNSQDDLFMQLDEAATLVSQVRVNEQNSQHCMQAVHLLRQCYHDFGTTPLSWPQLAWWPCKVSTEYLHLLSRSDPVALIIFRSWCCFVRRVPSRWFWDGWSDGAIECIEMALI